MLPFAYFAADKRIFVFVIAVILALYFVIVNNSALRGTATTYMIGALIVLAGLPMLRVLFKR